LLSRASFLAKDAIFNYSLEEIQEKYVEWVNTEQYMLLNRVNWKTYKAEIIAVRCSKRGNDIYRSRVYARFFSLVKDNNISWFDRNYKGSQDVHTQALFLTLTYDPKRCSYRDAWANIGKEFNRFMSRVRKCFGVVHVCRVFESFKNGYPHIHAILLFDESVFTCFRHYSNKKERWVWACREESQFADMWHSWLDMEGLSSLGRSFRYLKKYLLKAVDKEGAKVGSKHLKTLSLCWFFAKRAFSVSGKFRKRLSDLTKAMHNSNRKPVQMTLDNTPLEEDVTFYVMGFVPLSILGLKKGTFYAVLDDEQIKKAEEYCGERWGDRF
jgi:hypothetical protein